MSTTSVYKCDGCNKTRPNFYTEEGWLHFGGPVDISRALGKYDNSKGYYQSEFLLGVSDFCSFNCLALKLEETRRK